METMLRLGCDGRENAISFPYMETYSADIGEIDGYSKGARDGSTGYGVLIGNNIRLHAAPDEKAPVIATSNWDRYRFHAYSDNRDWAQISIAGDKKGWVKSTYLRDFSNYRMGFERKNGVWVMIYILAGT